jgi:hypothetical protein
LPEERNEHPYWNYNLINCRILHCIPELQISEELNEVLESNNGLAASTILPIF